MRGYEILLAIDLKAARARIAARALVEGEQQLLERDDLAPCEPAPALNCTSMIEYYSAATTDDLAPEEPLSACDFRHVNGDGTIVLCAVTK